MMDRLMGWMAAVAVGAALSTGAQLIPYPNAGIPAPVVSFVAASTGPVTAYFYANAVWGSGLYQFNWWISGLSGPGTAVPTTSDSVVSHVFTVAGDYLVTLIATDTMGTPDTKDDLVILLPPIKVTAVSLATPINPATQHNNAMVGSL